MDKQDDPKVSGVVTGNVNSGEVNIVGGDFVGRDNVVFLGAQTNIGGNVVGAVLSGSFHGPVTITPNVRLERISAQIDRLRGRVARLIPAEDALLQLAKLREPKPIGFWSVDEVSLSFVGITTRLRPPQKEDKGTDNASARHYLNQLGNIEAQIAPDIEFEKYSQLLQSLSNIADEINIRIAQLNSLFTSIVYPATASRELAENMVSKIGHKEVKDEANMHLGVISQLVKKLNAEKLTRPDLDVLSEEANGAVGLMTELEKRRLVVERLVHSDRSRRNWTIASVLIYICAIVAVTVYLIALWGASFSFGQTSLNQLRIPLLGIPWPVLIWSLIGSFAAMIYRFNAKPIYDFSDAVKWMITRPMQGVVLGSTLYLVLVSGLFILTAGNTSNPAGLISTDEVILVLCFLVGFSDKFADSVFNALVQRYSAKNTEQGEKPQGAA